MWKVVPGIAFSALPRRWRAAMAIGEETVPWVLATILSGILESVFAVAGLIYWYSRSVTTWAANALDSALRNGPAAEYDPHLLSSSKAWCASSAQFPSSRSCQLFLALADWCYGKFTCRAPEGGALHLPNGKEQFQSLLQAAKGAAKTIGLPEVPDKLVEVAFGADSILEIHSSRPKAEWTPPRVVRVGLLYYRLEAASEGSWPRPFIYRLRRLAAGVPGRSVLLYEPPHTMDSTKQS